MPTYAIIGASRGIGLEYVRQLSARADTAVFAIVRSAQKSTHLTKAISGKQNVHVVEADIVDYNSLEKAAEKVSEITGGTLDCLVHNAARMDLATVYLGFDHFPNMDALDADFIETYKVNTLGAIHSIAAFLPLLRTSRAPLKKVVVISSGGADPKFARAVGLADMAAYGMSKAATLVATTKWAIKLKDEPFVVISLSPGVVDTTDTLGENGNPQAKAGMVQAVEVFKAGGIPVELLSPEQSVSTQLKTIEALTPEQNGLFLTETGKEWAL